MEDKTITGRAYGFLDYEGKWSELVRDLDKMRREANFHEGLRLIATDNQLSSEETDKMIRSKYKCEREELPPKISEIARKTKTNNSISLDCSRKTFEKLNREKVRASSLRYIVMAQDPEPSEDYDRVMGQGRANFATASDLNQVLGYVGSRNIAQNKNHIFRSAIFYLDGRGKAQAL